MFDELSKIYAAVAQHTIATLPENWKAFWIREECRPSSWAYRCYYKLKDVDEITHFEGSDEATELLHDAWEISRANNDHWSSVEFHVVAPGELHITFGHEDLDDESVTQNDRMNVFSKRTFAGRKVVSIVDMSGAFSLTPEMLKSGSFQPNA